VYAYNHILTIIALSRKEIGKVAEKEIRG